MRTVTLSASYATGEIINAFKILTFEKFLTYCLGGFGAEVRIMIR
jgi:hypothetical protein